LSRKKGRIGEEFWECEDSKKGGKRADYSNWGPEGLRKRDLWGELNARKRRRKENFTVVPVFGVGILHSKDDDSMKGLSQWESFRKDELMLEEGGKKGERG